MDRDETTSDNGASEPSGIDMQALLDVASTEIAAQARSHPLRTLGVAFGVGYVLGGGLPRFVVRMATAAAIRTAGRIVLTAVPWSRLVSGFTDEVRARAPAPASRNGHSRASARE